MVACYASDCKHIVTYVTPDGRRIRRTPIPHYIKETRPPICDKCSFAHSPHCPCPRLHCTVCDSKLHDTVYCPYFDYFPQGILQRSPSCDRFLEAAGCVFGIMRWPRCCSCTSRFQGVPCISCVPTIGEMFEMWKKNQNPFGILYGWFLAKVATKLEVFPGAEFRVAYEEAMKYGGKVILGDRPVQITLRRTWAKLPLWHKTKLVYSFMFQAVFLPNPEDLNKALKEMDDVDMLTLVIQEMSKQFPTLMETLVHERDQYMSAKLLNIASQHNSVVAVLGKGHLPGIKKNWKQPVDLKEILTIPSQKRTLTVGNVLSTIGVTVAGISIISGLYICFKK